MTRSRLNLRPVQLLWLILALPCLAALQTPKQFERMVWLEGIQVSPVLGQPSLLHEQMQQQALEANQRLAESHGLLFYQWQWLTQIPHFVEKSVLVILCMAIFSAAFVIRAPPFSKFDVTP